MNANKKQLKKQKMDKDRVKRINIENNKRFKASMKFEKWLQEQGMNWCLFTNVVEKKQNIEFSFLCKDDSTSIITLLKTGELKYFGSWDSKEDVKKLCDIFLEKKNIIFGFDIVINRKKYN